MWDAIYAEEEFTHMMISRRPGLQVYLCIK